MLQARTCYQPHCNRKRCPSRPPLQHGPPHCCEVEAEASGFKYDAEGSGNISADAARAIVNEAVGKEVTDEVLRQLRSMCDCSPPDVTKPMRASDIQFLHQSSRAYGLQAERVTEVLRRYDLDKSGGLDFKELMIAMKEIAPQGSKVRAGDVSWIVEKYDLDGDGQLGFLELVPAVTAGPKLSLEPDGDDFAGKGMA